MKVSGLGKPLERDGLLLCFCPEPRGDEVSWVKEMYPGQRDAPLIRVKKNHTVNGQNFLATYQEANTNAWKNKYQFPGRSWIYLLERTVVFSFYEICWRVL